MYNRYTEERTFHSDAHTYTKSLSFAHSTILHVSCAIQFEIHACCLPYTQFHSPAHTNFPRLQWKSSRFSHKCETQTATTADKLCEYRVQEFEWACVRLLRCIELIDCPFFFLPAMACCSKDRPDAYFRQLLIKFETFGLLVCHTVSFLSICRFSFSHLSCSKSERKHSLATRTLTQPRHECCRWKEESFSFLPCGNNESELRNEKKENRSSRERFY